MTNPTMAVIPLLVALGLVVWPDRLPDKLFARAAGARLDRARQALVPLAAGAAIVVVFPDLWWLGALAVGGVAVARARAAGRRSPAKIVADRAELAAALDLIGACVRAGLPMTTALSAVQAAAASALDGESSASTEPAAANRPTSLRTVGVQAVSGSRAACPGTKALRQVHALLAVGAEPSVAWQPAQAEPDLASVASAACRSSSAGTSVADAFTEQATALRAQNAQAAVRSASRAGVLMTAPLGACFLPAFLCLGLAPAVVGLVRSLSLW